MTVPALFANNLFAVHLNECRELFIGNTPEPGSRIQFFSWSAVPPLAGNRLVQTALVGDRCFALTENGQGSKVFASDQLGGNDNFKEIFSIHEPVMMYASSDKVYFLTQSGHWYSASMTRTFMGHPSWSSVSQHNWQQELTLFPSEIVINLFPGENCSFLVTSHRFLVRIHTPAGYSILSHMIGAPPVSVNNNFVPIDMLPGAIQLACIKKVAFGARHIMILTLSGELYGAGFNDAGQLGLPSSQAFIPTFMLLRKSVSQVTAGAMHTVIQDKDGIYVAGFSSYSGAGTEFAFVAPYSDDLLLAETPGDAARFFYYQNQQLQEIPVMVRQPSPTLSANGSGSTNSLDAISHTSFNHLSPPNPYQQSRLVNPMNHEFFPL